MTISEKKYRLAKYENVLIYVRKYVCCYIMRQRHKNYQG